MNILPRYLLLFCTITTLSCCAIALEKADRDDFSARDCALARTGELDTHGKAFDDPTLNAFSFDCAVAVTIAGPGESREARAALRAKKLELAKFLLIKGLDVSYVNDDGETVLMSVIASFLPADWKKKASEKLIDMGVDIRHISNDGNTASDYAQFKGNEQIVRLLADSLRE